MNQFLLNLAWLSAPLLLECEQEVIDEFIPNFELRSTKMAQLPGKASMLRDSVGDQTVNRRSPVPHPFLLAAFLQYVDYFQTWTLVSRFGIGVEGNPLARLTWYTAWGWIIKLLIVPATLMIVEFHPSLQSYKDRGLYGMIILATSLIVVGIGFYAIFSKIILQ